MTDFGALYRIEKSEAVARARRALVAADGDVDTAAKALGIAPTTLRYYLDIQPSLEKTREKALPRDEKNESILRKKKNRLIREETEASAPGPDPDYAKKIVQKLAKAGEDGVGLLTQPYYSKGITIILYKTNVLVGNILANLNTEVGKGGNTEEIAGAVDRSILGIITLDTPQQKCNDAMVVKYIFSREGYGPTLYALGMQFSLSGKIMSDRHAVSDYAADVYKIMHKRSDIIKDPLDDYKHQLNVTHNKKHTPDPSDDCEVWYDTLPEKEFLDYTFEGGDVDVMTLKNNHKEAMEMLNHYIKDYLGWEQSTVEKYVGEVADHLFGQAYQKIPIEKRGYKPGAGYD